MVLWRRLGGAVGVERLHGLAAVAALRDAIYLRRPAQAMGRDAAMFAALSRLVTAGVTVWRLTLPDDPSCLDTAAADLLSVLKA